jgi:hypothetical protein
MNARRLMLSAALVAAVAAGGYHWATSHTRSRLEIERAHAVSDAAEQRRLADETARQVAVAESELQVLLAERTNRPTAAASPAPRSSPEGGTPAPRPKPAVAPPNPELRSWQVQAYVSDRRLRYAALLTRLGFTGEKRQAFDQIHAACQRVLLDETQPEAVRRQARETRDVQLKELFGPRYEQWVEAEQNDPARAIVAQIVRQTFQSSGALTTAQAEELTRLVAQHRLAPAKGAGSPGYDWDSIVGEAQHLLADRQRDDFIAAIEYRRASEKMSAMAAKKK